MIWNGEYSLFDVSVCERLTELELMFHREYLTLRNDGGVQRCATRRGFPQMVFVERKKHIPDMVEPLNLVIRGVMKRVNSSTLLW